MLLLLLALVAGLAGAPPAAADSVPNRFERLRAQDGRVAAVAYRLSIANAAACSAALAPQPGFVLHGIDQYEAGDREAAARNFALGPRPGVMTVVAGSPAARAGLRGGDQLEAVNGRALGSEIGEGAPSRASIDRAQAILVEEMRRGAVTLQLFSGGESREVRFTAERGCPAQAELVPNAGVNAWADGSRIIVSDGLLRLCARDDDLALVIAHEMAHNLLDHRRRLAAEGVSANRLLPLSEIQSSAVRETEEEADRLAVRLANAAGYDLSGAEAFIGGLVARGDAMAATHPGPQRRLALLHAAIAALAQRGATAGIANTASSGLLSGRM